jgi:hypothetical protein
LRDPHPRTSGFPSTTRLDRPSPTLPGRGPGWRFVDLLPRRAGKGAAMEWVRSRLGFAREHTVACGDGANDLLMLQQARAARRRGRGAAGVAAVGALHAFRWGPGVPLHAR